MDWVKVCEYMGGERTREQNCGRWNGVLKHRESKGLAVTQPSEQIHSAITSSDESSNGQQAAPGSASPVVNMDIGCAPVSSDSDRTRDVYQI